MAGVEFFEDHDTPVDPEPLPTRSRRPHWLVALLVAAAVALAVAVAVRATGSDAPIAAVSSPTSSAPKPTPQPVPPSDPDVVAVATLFARSATDVATDGRRVWSLQGGRLVLKDGASFRGADVLVGVADGSSARVLLDVPAGLVWVILPDVAHPIVQAFDSETLESSLRVVLPRRVTAVAALDGELYVADAAGMSRVDPRRGLQVVLAGFGGATIFDLAADPLRHRLVMLSAGKDVPDLHTFDVRTRALRSAVSPFDLIGGHVVVTGSGELWIGGQASGAVLARLDPDTLQARLAAAVTAQLGPAITVLSAGTDDVLVAGSAGQLWCVRGSDGATVQSWTVAAQRVAVRHGGAFATSPDGIVRLRLRGCTG